MHRRRSTFAFTLAELLVAIAITIVLVGILLRVFAATTAQWQSADQRIDTFRDARAALEFMKRDLGRANTNGSSKMLALADFVSDFAREAYAITPIPNTGKSDLCTAGYYCAYDPIAKAYSLKRLFKNSDATFTSLATSSADFTVIYQKSETDDVAAAYLWDLQIRPGIGASTVDPTTGASATWNWLEIRFKSMSPASGRKIRDSAVDSSTWFDATSPLYKIYILPYEQQFVSRIVLDQGP
jgi:type II secretory pathway pseudopilin PulG